MRRALPVALLAFATFYSIDSGTAVAQCEIHEDTKLTASDAATNDLFGRSVSINGNIAIVGTYSDDWAAGVDCGSVWVYRFNGNSWVEEQQLVASDAAPNDRFGISVSISGGVAVVGALYDVCSDGRYCGSAYVYRFNGSLWVEEQKLTASDEADSALFGFSAAVSGNTAIVGAPEDYCGASFGCGSAYIYRFNGSSWVEEQKLTALDAATYDQFGYSVSVSEDVAVVGIPRDNCVAGADCGSVYVYRFNGSAWINEQELGASDAADSDYFGWSVSIHGDSVVVGATNDGCVGANTVCGSAYVYRFNGSNWVEEQKLTASNAAAGDDFGFSVSVSGNVAVIGARADDCGSKIDCGSACVYRFNGTGWEQQAELTASDGTERDYFGFSVAVSGDLIIVGSMHDNCEDGEDCGSAYVYTLGDCNSNGIADECDIASETSADCNENGIPDECEELPCPPLLGACCDHDPFGGCMDGLSRAECNCPRCEWAQDTLCDDVECSRDSIPTVSAWGLAILSLLLLIGAKIRFRRVYRCVQ